MADSNWQAGLRKQDPRLAQLKLLDLAKEAGAEHEPFLRNALKGIRAFSYDSKVVEEILRDAESRLISRIVSRELGRTSVPRAELFKGSIPIGDIVGTRGVFSLEKKHFPRGMFIAGIPGSGKTNLIKNLVIEHKKQGIHVLIFDFKNEYSELLRHELFSDLVVIDAEELNPELLRSPFNDAYGWFQLVIDLLRGSGFTMLSSHRRLVLEQAKRLLLEKGYLEFLDLTEEIERIVENKFLAVRDRDRLELPLEILTSVLDQLHLSKETHVLLENLLTHDVVIRMHRLSQKLQTFMASFILSWLFYFKDFNGDRETPLLCIFDEAKLLFAREKERTVDIPALRLRFTQMRYLNMGFILADQHPSLLVDYATNVHTYICCTLTGEEEVRSAAHSLLAGEKQRQELFNLPLGYALVKVPAHPVPFKIFIKKAPDLRAIGEQELRQFMRPAISALKAPSQNRPEQHRVVESQPSVHETTSPGKLWVGELESFLRCVLEHPDAATSHLYALLKLSARKGTRLKREMVDQGMIEEMVAHTGERKRPQKRLRLTKKGEELLASFKSNGNA